MEKKNYNSFYYYTKTNKKLYQQRKQSTYIIRCLDIEVYSYFIGFFMNSSFYI